MQEIHGGQMTNYSQKCEVTIMMMFHVAGMITLLCSEVRASAGEAMSLHCIMHQSVPELPSWVM